jgi:8-amino-3,8-dideoxy-alpha-D-manno-octulosonate transaminase
MAGMELFGAEERKEVNDVLETGILFRYNYDEERKGHWKTRDFEKELAEFVGVKHCHACTSGSTAVSIALASAGIGAGDEVIVPPFTFMATIEAVLTAGGIPVFAEIDDTLCLSPEGIKNVITSKTKAVLLVHMCGAMAKLDEIVSICEENNIVLIEDSAQALGCTYKGKPIGTFGKTASFSFDFFKIISCGEGGAAITNDTDIYNKMHPFADHGHNHEGNNRGAEEHPILGFNYRLGELNAAVGLAQVRKLPLILEQQKKNKKILKDALAKFKEVSFRNIPDEDGDSATFMNFFLPDEAATRKVVSALLEEGVGGVQYWYDNNYHYIKNWEHLKEMKTAAPLALQFMDVPQDYKTLQLPKSDAVVSRLISLVVKVDWPEDEKNDYIEKLNNALKKALA